MPTLTQLGDVLTTCRIATEERWQRAVKLGVGDLTKTLDALTAFTPDWWTPAEGEGAESSPGLTDYQRGVIEHWFEDGGPPPYRQLSLNRFLLLDRLGRGGQGEVFRARQLSPSRFVAVKTLTQDTETGRERFEQEARAMMKVQHPGVARFYLYERVRDAAGKPTDEYLIAMEYVEGTDLHRLGQWLGPVPWAFAAKWAVDLLGGLAEIHKAGFIHRDIKPANVMILGTTPEPGASPGDSAAKLLDFGAAKLTDSGPRGSGRKRIFVGTREYAPPEQWAERVVPASDLYALGATLFHALTGRPPYEVEGREATAFRAAHARAPIPAVRDSRPDVPEAFDSLIQRMLAKDPDDRGTAAELRTQFRALLPPEPRPAEARDAAASASSLPKRPPASRPQPARLTEVEDESRGVSGSFLGALERIFLPAHLRPLPGHEPPASERIAALLRRPLVLVTLMVLLGLLIFLVVRA